MWMVNERIVPSTQRPSLFYWRLLDFRYLNLIQNATLILTPLFVFIWSCIVCSNSSYKVFKLHYFTGHSHTFWGLAVQDYSKVHKHTKFKNPYGPTTKRKQMFLSQEANFLVLILWLLIFCLCFSKCNTLMLETLRRTITQEFLLIFFMEVINSKENKEVGTICFDIRIQMKNKTKIFMEFFYESFRK